MSRWHCQVDRIPPDGVTIYDVQCAGAQYRRMQPGIATHCRHLGFAYFDDDFQDHALIYGVDPRQNVVVGLLRDTVDRPRRNSKGAAVCSDTATK